MCGALFWVVQGGRGKAVKERGVFPPLNASAAEHLWACHGPSARLHSPGAALLGLYIQAIGPSPFPLEQGPLFALGQQWLCFLIQKMSYRRGLYHPSCFANVEIEREKGAAYPQVMEMSSSEEQDPCPCKSCSYFIWCYCYQLKLSCELVK